MERVESGDIGLPLYTTPELSFTVTGTPMISLRKAEGSLPSEGAAAVAVV
jgi:hypothetical protein